MEARSGSKQNSELQPATPRSRLQGLLRTAGSVTAVFSVVFFFSALANGFRDEHLYQLVSDSPARYLFFNGFLAIAVFVLCNTFGALGWQALLKSLGSALPLLHIIPLFFLSVPAKYLPGNVGHFIGRGILAKPLGVAIKRSTLSFLLESAILAAVALSIALLLAAPIRTLYGSSPRFSLSEIVLVVIVGTLAAIAASELVRLRGVVLPSRTSMLTGILTAASLNLLCFLALGALTIVLMPSIDYWTATSAFALAFVAGFLVPGAPAGIGVREAVFVASVSDELRPTAAATIALIRVAQIIADGLTFIIGKQLRKAVSQQPVLVQ